METTKQIVNISDSDSNKEKITHEELMEIRADLEKKNNIAATINLLTVLRRK